MGGRALRRVLLLVGTVGLAAGVTFVAWNAGGDDDETRPARTAATTPSPHREPAAPGAAPTSTAPTGSDDVRALKTAATATKLTTRLYLLSSDELAGLPPSRLAERLGLPADGPGSLSERTGGILVDAHLRDASEPTLASLQSAGARIVHTEKPMLTATVEVPVDRLRTVASLPGVESLEEVLQPLSHGTCTQGGVVSEGDAQLRAADARADGRDGSGERIGILSDSFDKNTHAATHAPGDVNSGDLPGSLLCLHPITPVLEPVNTTFATDEGRAMAQLAHDLAPEASIGFATASDGENAFANNIRTLAAAPHSSRVISDDVLYYDEPFFQDSVVAKAINDVAVSNDVVYVTAAGNEHLTVGGKSVGAYEAPALRPTKCPASFTVFGDAPAACHDFSPGSKKDPSFDFTVGPHKSFNIDLQWSEPWYGIRSDIDLFVLDANTKQILSFSLSNNFQTKKPFEFAGFTNSSGSPRRIKIVVHRSEGGKPRLKWVLFTSPVSGLSSFERTSGTGDVYGQTIVGHGGATGAATVAAVPYSNPNVVEPYSSRGPVRHYWGPVVGTTPAGKKPTVQIIAKPDFAATDGGLTTFFSAATHRFFGTSASSAHAAGVAALVRQARPSSPAAEVLNAMRFTTRPVASGGGLQAVGRGLLDAEAAANAVAGTSLSISVDSDPGSGQDFAFSTTGPGATRFTLDGDARDATHDDRQTLGALTPGTYTITEAVPPGWVVEGVSCDDGQSPLVVDGSVAVEVAPDRHVTCVFTNVRTASLTVVHHTLPEDSQDFSYTVDPGDTTVQLDDDGDTDRMFDGAHTFTDLVPGAYSVTQAPVAGWQLVDVRCDDGSVAAVLDGHIDVTVQAAGHVTCVFTDAPLSPGAPDQTAPTTVESSPPPEGPDATPP